jgi:hypothetical protein
MLHAPIDMDLQDFADLSNLLGVTKLALVLGIDDLALATTVAAGLLDLLHHGSHLAKHDSVTLAVTGGTGLDSALLATLTLTFLADDVLLEGELGGLAFVEILQSDLQSMSDVLAAARSSGTTAPTAATAAKEV